MAPLLHSLPLSSCDLSLCLCLESPSVSYKDTGHWIEGPPQIQDDLISRSLTSLQQRLFPDKVPFADSGNMNSGDHRSAQDRCCHLTAATDLQSSPVPLSTPSWCRAAPQLGVPKASGTACLLLGWEDFSLDVIQPGFGFELPWLAVAPVWFIPGSPLKFCFCLVP